MEGVDLKNLTEDDYLEMAKYCGYLEAQNQKLLSELQQAKAYLAATVQQRNSAEIKLKTLVEQRANTIDIKAVHTAPINTNIELINPEQWAVPAGRVSVTPKSNKL